MLRKPTKVEKNKKEAKENQCIRRRKEKTQRKPVKKIHRKPESNEGKIKKPKKPLKQLIREPMYNKEKKEMKKQRKKTRRAVLQRTRADLRKLDGPMVAGLLAIPIRNRFRRDITLRYCLVVLITKNTGMCTRSGAVR